MTEEKVIRKYDGGDALAYIDQFLTPEEIAASNRRVARMGKRLDARDRRRAALRYIVTGIAMLLPKSKHVNIPHQS